MSGRYKLERDVSRKSIRTLLAGGDRRSIGRADEVAELVIQNPALLGELVECLWDSDPVVCMRGADAAEKASRGNQAMLAPFREALLNLAAETERQEVRWHLALMIPRLRLTSAERFDAARLLETYLGDRSSIVRTFAMQGLADLAEQDGELRPRLVELLRSSTDTGTPAMRARGRKLLAELEGRG